MWYIFIAGLRLSALLAASLFFVQQSALAAVSVTGIMAASTGTSAAASSLVVTPVAGAARGDLLLAQVTIDSTSATIAPSLSSAAMASCSVGWMEITAITQSYNGLQQRIYACIRSQ